MGNGKDISILGAPWLPSTAKPKVNNPMGIDFLEINGLFGSLKKEGGRIIQLPCLKVFLRKEGEGFGGVSTTSNSSFLISPNWRDLEGE